MAGLLKLFLRELPECIFTTETFSELLAASRQYNLNTVLTDGVAYVVN